MSDKVISFEDYIEALNENNRQHMKDKKAILVVASLIAVCWMITALYAFGTINSMTKIYFETPYDSGNITNTNTNTLSDGVE